MLGDIVLRALLHAIFFARIFPTVEIFINKLPSFLQLKIWWRLSTHLFDDVASLSSSISFLFGTRTTIDLLLGHYSLSNSPKYINVSWQLLILPLPPTGRISISGFVLLLMHSFQHSVSIWIMPFLTKLTNLMIFLLTRALELVCTYLWLSFLRIKIVEAIEPESTSTVDTSTITPIFSNLRLSTKDPSGTVYQLRTVANFAASLELALSLSVTSLMIIIDPSRLRFAHSPPDVRNFAEM